MVRRGALPTLALASLSVAVAASLRGLFDTGDWAAPVLAAAVAPHALGLLTRGRRARTTLAASASGLAAFVLWGLAPAAADGIPNARTWAILAERLSEGWHVLRTEAAPVAARPGALLLAVLTVWTMATVADLLARRAGAALGALAPAITVFIWVAALGGDAEPVSAIVVCVAAAAFLATQQIVLGAPHRTRVGGAGGRRGVTGAVGAVAVTAVLATVAAAVAPVLPGTEAHGLFDLGSRDGDRHDYQTTIAPLADVSDKLRQSQEVELFTVRSRARDYWRLTALDDYRAGAGGQWTLRASGGAIADGLHEPVPADAFVQRFRIGPLGERWMPAAYRPVQVRGADVLVVRASRTLVTAARSVVGARYRVVSAPSVLAVDDAERLGTARPVPRALRRYVRLPRAVPTVVRTLATEVTADEPTPFDKARALRDFFRSGTFTYDPTVDLNDELDATVEFLRIRRGFCVQFASTYALMARAVGIPARVAVGFTPGTYDPVTRSYRVTNHDAHAWPEIWLPGLGWTHLFDPTPVSALAGGSDLPGDTAPVPTARDTEAGSAEVPVSPATSPTAAPGAGPAAPSTPTGHGSREPAGRGLPAMWLGLGVVVVVGLAVPGSVLTIKARRRSRRRRQAGAAAQVGGAWQEAIDRLVEAGARPRPSETAHEIAARSTVLAGPDGARLLTRLADLQVAARFSTTPVSDADAAKAWETLHDLEAALRARFDVRTRWRARMTIASRRDHPDPTRQPRSTVVSSSTKD